MHFSPLLPPPTAIVATGVGGVDTIDPPAADDKLLETDDVSTAGGREETAVVIPSDFSVAGTGMADPPVADETELEAPPSTVTGASDGSMEQRTDTIGWLAGVIPGFSAVIVACCNPRRMGQLTELEAW